ncbi:UNVERIFIED_CONTAM: hypothetical protein PYX00_008585 [Menopon gallinae]|uniref:F-box domain-containing protein n=1 Tax=Menopon gallinae TaxID=328185 RepID=A0AAW2HNT8_9NEOP
MGNRTVSELPNEILFCIFSYLKMYDLKYNIPGVCKQWETLSKDRRLWKKLTYETTSEVTKTFGAKSWDSTLKFLETTPQLQNVVISQGHSESEILELLNALNNFCWNLHQIELDMTPTVAKHFATLSRLREKIESLRLRLVPERSHKEVFKALAKFPRLRKVTFVGANPQHRDFQSFLSNCPHLEHLNLSNDEFCKTNFIMLLNKKERFHSLFLRTDNLDRYCISELSHFPKLIKLKLADNNASPGKLIEIGNLACLESLALREDASSPVLTSFCPDRFSQLRKLLPPHGDEAS